MELDIAISVCELDDCFGLTVAGVGTETVEYFERRGLEGNGYTWDGVVDSIARLEMPECHDQISSSPEADDLLVTCNDRQVLERLAEQVRRYAADVALMDRAIEEADPDLLE